MGVKGARGGAAPAIRHFGAHGLPPRSCRGYLKGSLEITKGGAAWDGAD